MSAAAKYLAYLGTLHLVIGVLIYQVVGRGPVLLLVEMVLLLSAYLGYRLYEVLVAPLQLLSRGVGALADQDFSVKMRSTGSPEMDRLGEVYNRMIEQLRLERVAGRQREEFLDRLVEAAGVGLLVLDYDGNIESENPWVQERRKSSPEFEATVLRPALALGVGEQAVFTTPDNRRLHVEYATFVDRGFERGFIILQDVTADLLQAEKEAYGKVIRMMAHEVNNSNAAIVSLLKTLLEVARADEPDLAELSREHLPPVILRAEHLTAFMRNFARVVRLPAPARERIDLNAVLRGAAEVMQPLLEEQEIALSLALADRPVWVSADRAQLEQVLINALTNARESIGRGGHIRISSQLHPAGFVIADDGPGIPAEVADRLFTPFFSTKSSGQGVGLTLSREILEAHGASYRLRTEEDGVTRFRVSLS
ncbi:signal transduction histidine kinase [Lewinella marina]|uniref:histidine kinase n=1 Tax=Neolewinella marina TaxID=438751 RepID=A0A2G0CEN9_9BACT|nr:ATP-binding protein [Neolewinella marina]NJB87222.1 signal transduction histidine kinase [Neolewinella marina]PHK98451.1 histidine kinase [Neolewinella marina]